MIIFTNEGELYNIKEEEFKLNNENYIVTQIMISTIYNHFQIEFSNKFIVAF